MKQVVQSARSGKLSLRDVPAPGVKAGHLLVRNRASLISAGTERMVVGFAKKSLLAKARARPDLVRKVMDKARRDGIGATMRSVLARLDEPLPLGYSASADVVAIGAGLEGAFQVGQRVAVAGAGLANHAELNVIPRNLAVAVPDGVADEEACFATLGAISLHGVRNLNLGLGDTAAVVGVGLVGQLAIQFLNLAGIRAIAFDYDPERLDLAWRMGAETVWNLADGGPAEAVASWTAGLGCDGVLIAAATDSSDPMTLAAEIARDRARISLVGITGTEFPYREFMKKELSLVVSRSYGPGRYDDDYEGRDVKYPEGHVRWTETANLAESVRLMAPGRNGASRLDVAALITHRFPFAEAEAAYTMITAGETPHLGVVLTYPEKSEKAAAVVAPKFGAVATPRTGKCVLGVIGAGNFARSQLLPALRDMKECQLHTIVTQRGISAEHSQERFGFTQAETETAAVLDNAEINAVLIATPHSSHAALTTAALKAGKSVFVEKPLALTHDELNQVVAARNDADGFFLVGFNRRFAPMAVAARARLAARDGPKFLVLRVNAGRLPPDSWQGRAEEGQGRILGEVCHFIDLAAFLVGAPVVAVTTAAATAAGNCEDVSVTLEFADGGLATIAYTALGDTAFSKERFECYAGGMVVSIDNFRTMTVAADGKVKTNTARLGQDKGHKAEMRAFVAAVAAGGPAPVDEAALINASRATIAVLESLQSGHRVTL